jgi:hypothetical protein
MRSATVSAALWFLVGVAAALSWTSLTPLTIPLAIVLVVVALRAGLRDRRLWSAALIGAAVVFLFFGARQWGVPDCTGGSGETGSVTIHPGESAESRCGGLSATPVIVVAVLLGALGAGVLAAYAHATRKAPNGV